MCQQPTKPALPSSDSHPPQSDAHHPHCPALHTPTAFSPPHSALRRTLKGSGRQTSYGAPCRSRSVIDPNTRPTTGIASFINQPTPWSGEGKENDNETDNQEPGRASSNNFAAPPTPSSHLSQARPPLARLERRDWAGTILDLAAPHTAVTAWQPLPNLS